MASISKERPANIQFVATDGRRRSLRLGKISEREANSIKFRVESILETNRNESVDDDTAAWLASRDDRMAAKLARVGLTAKRPSSQLEAFLEGYRAARVDLGESTQEIVERAAESDWLFRS